MHFQETGDAKSSARMLPASSHVLLRVMRVIDKNDMLHRDCVDMVVKIL